MATVLTTSRNPYIDLIGRLNNASARHIYQAYADIDWDDSSMAIDPADPRWELTSTDPLGTDPWYLDLPPARRRRIGLHRAAETMKVNIEFKNAFQRGLLLFASTLPNHSPEFRYVFHEIAEEAQHSLMFQEFIDRSGAHFEPSPSSGGEGYSALIDAGRDLPALVFLNALICEDINDHFQRRRLTCPGPPVLRRIFHIHVRGEARHRSFGRAFLAEHAPDLPACDRTRLADHAPSFAADLAHRLLLPSATFRKRFGIPDHVAARITSSDHFRFLCATAIADTKDFLSNIGLIPDQVANLWNI